MHDHHALLFFGEGIEAASLEDAYQKPSADVSHVLIDSFGIDDARVLSDTATQMPVVLSKRVFVIVTASMTVQAQNALLKLFEEPPAHAQFYVVMPRGTVLLPTLLSRMHVSSVEDIPTGENETFTTFASASYAQRMEIVAKLAKEKDTKTIGTLLAGIEQYIQKQPHTYKELLRSLLLARSYVTTPGASAKMLLEEIALSLPKI